MLMHNGVTFYEPRDLTAAFGADAAAFIHTHKAQPFFLYLATEAVHVPIPAKGYSAYVSRLDSAVGATISALKLAKVYNNTLIFFVSDNGGATSVGGNNTPLRGGKDSLFDGGIRVPFLAIFPGQPHKVYDLPVSTLDILPAIASFTGTKPLNAALDGVNLRPFLAGSGGEPHHTLCWNLYRDVPAKELHACRVGNAKFVVDRLHYPTAPTSWWTEMPTSEVHGPVVPAVTAAYNSWIAQMPMPLWSEWN